jgi:hypothetical protein
LITANRRRIAPIMALGHDRREKWSGEDGEVVVEVRGSLTVEAQLAQGTTSAAECG